MEMHPPCKRISFVSILFVLAFFKKSQSSRKTGISATSRLDFTGYGTLLKTRTTLREVPTGRTANWSLNASLLSRCIGPMSLNKESSHTKRRRTAYIQLPGLPASIPRTRSP
jgi:hypothetical protein